MYLTRLFKAEQVKKRKLEAIGARTHLQSLSRENQLKKVSTNILKRIKVFYFVVRAHNSNF